MEHSIKFVALSESPSQWPSGFESAVNGVEISGPSDEKADQEAYVRSFSSLEGREFIIYIQRLVRLQ